MMLHSLWHVVILAADSFKLSMEETAGHNQYKYASQVEGYLKPDYDLKGGSSLSIFLHHSPISSQKIISFLDKASETLLWGSIAKNDLSLFKEIFLIAKATHLQPYIVHPSVLKAILPRYFGEYRLRHWPEVSEKLQKLVDTLPREEFDVQLCMALVKVISDVKEIPVEEDVYDCYIVNLDSQKSSLYNYILHTASLLEFSEVIEKRVILVLVKDVRLIPLAKQLCLENQIDFEQDANDVARNLSKLHEAKECDEKLINDCFAAFEWDRDNEAAEKLALLLHVHDRWPDSLKARDEVYLERLTNWLFKDHRLLTMGGMEAFLDSLLPAEMPEISKLIPTRSKYSFAMAEYLQFLIDKYGYDRLTMEIQEASYPFHLFLYLGIVASPQAPIKWEWLHKLLKDNVDDFIAHYAAWHIRNHGHSDVGRISLEMDSMERMETMFGRLTLSSTQ